MSVSQKWPTSSTLHPNYSKRAPLKLKCSTSHFEHCAAAERSTGNPAQIWLESLKNREFHDFHNFHKIWSLMRRPSPVKISRHREATDMRLSPIDSLYFKVHGKIRPSQNKLRDFEISGKFDLK